MIAVMLIDSKTRCQVPIPSAPFGFGRQVTFVILCLKRSKPMLNKAQAWEGPITALPSKDVDAGPEVVVDADGICPDEFSEKLKNDEEASLAGSTATPASSHNSQVDLEIASVGGDGAVISSEDTSRDVV